jgi:hypothetical protein
MFAWKVGIPFDTSVGLVAWSAGKRRGKNHIAALSLTCIILIPKNTRVMINICFGRGVGVETVRINLLAVTQHFYCVQKFMPCIVLVLLYRETCRPCTWQRLAWSRSLIAHLIYAEMCFETPSHVSRLIALCYSPWIFFSLPKRPS